MNTIPVQYTTGDATPVALVAFDDFSAGGNAAPTCRVLDGSCDHGSAEEWAEPGHIVIDGERRPAERIYLFDADEVADDADNYPWDTEHCARILLRD